MLGKQRKNQIIDSKFMDTAWGNMAEILDQEMPVEKKERRIGWLSIAAILVMGFVGGISVMWGLQKHQVAPMATNDIISNSIETGIATIETQEEVNLISTTLNNSAYSSNTRLDQISTNSNAKKITNNNAPATTIKKEQLLTVASTNQNSFAKQDDLDLVKEAFVQNKSIVSGLVDEVVSEAPIVFASTSVMISSDENLGSISASLSKLPTLGLTTLPAVDANFSIGNDIDLPKNKKWKNGVYAGAIVAGTKGNGLEAGMRAERKLSAKWAVETGLGIRATQLGFLNINERSDDLAFESSDGFVGSIASDPDAAFSEREIASRINADEPNYQLTVPLSLVFKPTGKLRLALGMNWAYRLNKLKDASTFSTTNGTFLEDDFAENSFSERLENFRLNFGVGYYLNPRTGIELAFAKKMQLGDNGKYESDFDDALASFFQIGVTHYFGK